MFRPYIDSSYYERPGYIVTTIPYLWFAVPKLDEDNDGKVSAQELYDPIVGILRSIFDGFDVNRNGVLEKSEAIPENLFRPQFVQNIIMVIFRLADRNEDDVLSMDDVPLLGGYGGQKLNETEDLCLFLFDPRQEGGMEEYRNQISPYLPLLDV